MKFLHVVENKLSKAFLGSNYYNRTIDVNRVVSFRVPTDSFSRETTNHHVWDLAELESSTDPKEEHLVSTSHLTEPGNRRKTPALRKWADKDPEMKEVSKGERETYTDLYSRSCKRIQSSYTHCVYY